MTGAERGHRASTGPVDAATSGGSLAAAEVPAAAAAPQELTDLRGVLQIAPFRRLWFALSISSLGDWLGLLATTALASELSTGFAAQNYAIGGVLFIRLLPAVLLGPLAGAMADRFNRRVTMVTADLIRAGFYISIPLVRSLVWLLIASFVIESVSLFWIPAKEASVPNLLPKERLQAANQLSLLTTYGSAPVAAAVFFVLSLLNSVLAAGLAFFRTNSVDLALYFDGVTFLFSAYTIFRLREIGRARRAEPAPEQDAAPEPGLIRSITEGWRFVGNTPMIRGLVLGIVGAFAAGGAVVALGKQFTANLGGGNAAYGVLFGSVFIGLAGGMFVGPRLLVDFSRRRMFGLAILGAGISLSVNAILPNLVLALVAIVAIGAFAGIAWVVGYTLLGLEVADDVRGRTFALVQSLVRIDLLVVLAVAPFLAGAIGVHVARIGRFSVRLDGVSVVLFVGGLLAAATGFLSYRQMDDRRGVPLRTDLLAALRHEMPSQPSRTDPGLFVAFEGGEGAGKSTQVRLLLDWLQSQRYDVVVTREPGATAVGARLRELLLSPGGSGPAPRTEALLYAADRAEHVETVIRPALDRGAVVVTDRYVDSTLAYQGAGRHLPAGELRRISRWASGGLVPDLTVLLDVVPEVGRTRRGAPADRIEGEPADFHDRVRRGFLALAEREPKRYLVVDAAQPPELVARLVRERLASRLAGPPDATAAGRPRRGSQAMSAPEA
jgi:dTMP kinase